VLCLSLVLSNNLCCTDSHCYLICNVIFACIFASHYFCPFLALEVTLVVCGPAPDILTKVHPYAMVPVAVVDCCCQDDRLCNSTSPSDDSIKCLPHPFDPTNHNCFRTTNDYSTYLCAVGTYAF